MKKCLKISLLVFLSLSPAFSTAFAQEGEADVEMKMVDSCEDNLLALAVKKYQSTAEYETEQNVEITHELKVDLMRAAVGALLTTASLHAAFYIDELAFERSTVSLVRVHHLGRYQSAYTSAYGQMPLEKWQYLINRNTNDLEKDMRMMEQYASVPDEQVRFSDRRLSRVQKINSRFRFGTFLITIATASAMMTDRILHAVTVEEHVVSRPQNETMEHAFFDGPREEVYEVLGSDIPGASDYRSMLLDHCYNAIKLLMDPKTSSKLQALKFKD